MQSNGVQIDNTPNIIVITDSDQNQISVTQPITSVIEVAALGPQGPIGPQGIPGPSGSSKWTGSNPISRDSDVEITGSLKITGSFSPPIISQTQRLSLPLVYTGSLVYQSDGETGYYVYF